MISESTGISLNVASFPVVKKKTKSKRTPDIVSKPYGPDLTVAKKRNAATSKIPQKSDVPISNEPVGILKNTKPAVSTSIWKKFKHANKNYEANCEFVKPVAKPVRLVKKKVKVKEEDAEVVSPSDVSFGDNKKNLKKCDNIKSSAVQDSKKSHFRFLDSGDVEVDVEKVNKSKSKVKFAGKSDFTSESSKKEYNTGKTTSLFWNNPEIPNIPHRAVKPPKETVFSNLTFEDVELHPYMVKYLKESMGLTKMTTVQEKSIPVLLKKQDALIRSQTGSGKTLAFALPILHRLQEVRPKISRSDGVLVLIVVPTRELALQIYEVFSKLVKSYTWIVPGYLVGGEKRKSEKARLRKGISVLIGTPGRLIDHIQHTKALNLDKVSWLVIDEADRLLDMGYEKDVSVLLDALNKDESRLLKPSYFIPEEEKKMEEKAKDRQTVLLSATLTQKVEKLAGLSLRDPVFVDACDENLVATSHVPVFGDGEVVDTMVLPEGLVQKYVVTPPKLKLVVLTSFILWKSKLTNEKKMLVFFATQDMVDYYTRLLSSILSKEDDDTDDEDSPLSNLGLELFKLHGNMKQGERTEVFKTFRKSQLGVLLCTDVASRGLDLPEVDWVIQYTGPTSVSDYVHRVGRTARGGHSGSSVILLTPTEVDFIAKLENCQIRLREEKMENCLEKLTEVNPRRASIPQEEATSLQTKFENLVAHKEELYDLGCKAFASWSRFYASYPRSMRDAFNVKAIHQGHYAKSFALRDSPTAIINYAKKRNLNEERFPRRRLRERKPEEGERKPLRGKSRFAEMSEFDSGLEPLKKRKKT